MDLFLSWFRTRTIFLWSAWWQDLTGISSSLFCANFAFFILQMCITKRNRVWSPLLRQTSILSRRHLWFRGSRLHAQLTMLLVHRWPKTGKTARIAQIGIAAEAPFFGENSQIEFLSKLRSSCCSNCTTISLKQFKSHCLNCIMRIAQV